MAFNWMLPVRIFQALLAILVLALTAFVANWYNTSTFTASPSQVNFLLFCGIWTFVLAVPYLVLAPRYFAQAAHKYGILAAEAVTMLFWFAGFIALAVFISNLLFCRGNVCRAAQAATVFGALEWILFTTTTILAAIHVVRTRNTSNNKPAPQMQVHPGV
jgi:uncharacterized membrane protein (DUF485 family)